MEDASGCESPVLPKSPQSRDRSLADARKSIKILKNGDYSPAFRWKKGELIGCGAYGRVYMGMDLDSGELLAVKQVSIAASNGSKEKAQAQIMELEEEVKLLRNLSHPNIVRYLGTAREDDALNILLEFVPGGSISSLLGKFGSFTEPVVRKYTKQLLQGLEYLHSNGIMHRDIKGANILVDNKGCIKLADFGASKKVVELATISGAKSMKGTPYWMAPEVIRQTGHGLSADIWSVGCTVIEMATGKPPWSQQFQEVAALFHIGTTKSHPPIPEYLSPDAKDFLQKCLNKEPNLRPTATELLQHPFIVCNYREPHPLVRSSMIGGACDAHPSVGRSGMGIDQSQLSIVKANHFEAAQSRFSLRRSSTVKGNRDPNNSIRSSAWDRSLNFLRQSKSFIRNSLDFNGILSATKSIQDMPNLGSVRSSLGRAFSVRHSTVNDMGTSSMKCRTSNMFPMEEDENCSTRLDSIGPDFLTKSFNPMSEPLDDDVYGFRFNESGHDRKFCVSTEMPGEMVAPAKGDDGFSFQCARSVDDDEEVTESKIRAFLDEKALELKKLQTPLYEEFFNTINASLLKENNGGCGSPMKVTRCNSQSGSNADSLGVGKRLSDASVNSSSPALAATCNPLNEISSPKLNEWIGLQESQQQTSTPSFSERQRLWKQELDQELERKREELRKRNGGKLLSPKFKLLPRQRDRSGGNTPK